MHTQRNRAKFLSRFYNKMKRNKILENVMKRKEMK